MSGPTQHQEFADSLGAYVLGALPEDEAARLQDHLRGCRECRAQFEWLRVAADALPASVPAVEPPPELRSRVMETVRSEAELLRAAGEGADRPPARHRTVRWPGLSLGLLRPAAALAVAAAVIAVAVVVATGGSPLTRRIVVQTRGVGTASLIIRGTEARLLVQGFRRPPAGHVDELWVKHGRAAPEPAGTFVLRSGTVQLERPVRPGDLVLVTVEPGGGTPAPTTEPFLVARA